MKLSDIRKIRKFCEQLHSCPDWREVVKEIELSSCDFEVDEVRFIFDGDIHKVLEHELSGDQYILGCFNARAIAKATGWPVALIEAAQKGEQFEEIGKALTEEHISKLAEIYSSSDGYGHHFNHYDGREEEIEVNGMNYYVFDNH